MGTRAMIDVNGKPFIATHWDGYPTSLGEDLLKMKKPTISNIVRVAKQHQIDFVDSSVQKKLNEERLKYLAKKHRLPLTKIKKGFRRGQVISAEDHEILPLKVYDDWAEYEYDIDTKTGEIKVRGITGSWMKKKAGKWNKINMRNLKKLEKVI